MKKWFDPVTVLFVAGLGLLMQASACQGSTSLSSGWAQSSTNVTNLAVERDNVDDYLIARPAKPSGSLFVFYPGGLVPPRAYSLMAQNLAARGVTVVIPVMPNDLAFFGIYRASSVREALAANGETFSKLVVGGHSLGGAMAAWYAAWLPVDALVLMASYPPFSLSTKTFPVLDLAAEFDGLAKLEQVKASLPNLPKGTQFEVLPGGIHAFFGRYGDQKGDGVASVSREDFEALMLKKLNQFFDKL